MVINVILVFLAAFIIVGVAYNFWKMQQTKPRSYRNVLFTHEPILKTHQPEVAQAQVDPIIDPSIQAFSKPHTPSYVEKPPVQQPKDSTLISVLVMSEPVGSYFLPYELLQALSGVHCVFGEMGIFHKHENSDGTGKTLFSIAQAVNPGTFDVSNIGALECPGLMLFTDAAMSDDPHAVFHALLETAQQLAEDLNAKLYEIPGKPLTQESLYAYAERLDYALHQREQLKATVV